MALNQYRPLRQITVGAGVWPPANDVDWVPSLTAPTPANIPQLEFDVQALPSAYGIVFYADFVNSGTGAKVARTNQTYNAQLIEVANPQSFITATDPISNTAVGGCSKSGIPFYDVVLIPYPGPGIYALRITGVAGADPSAGAFDLRLRWFMRGL